jgi:hypothetical protein
MIQGTKLFVLMRSLCIQMGFKDKIVCVYEVSDCPHQYELQGQIVHAHKVVRVHEKVELKHLNPALKIKIP